MAHEPVDYDRIASVYSRRYTVNPLPAVAAALHSLVQPYRAGRVLEVGCGTGRWLDELGPQASVMAGLDRSPGMLRQARHSRPSRIPSRSSLRSPRGPATAGRPGRAGSGEGVSPGNAGLVAGDAAWLPFPAACFDLVFCVNALHHFGQPARFIAETGRLLRPGGRLAVVGMDPHAGQEEWYIYQYFPETYELDLARFPPGQTILEWMKAAGFVSVERRLAERIRDEHIGRDILQDYFLGKQATSQLTLLSDDVYAAGLERIRAAVQSAEAAGKRLIFPVDISLMLFTGVASTTQVRSNRFSGSITSEVQTT